MTKCECCGSWTEDCDCQIPPWRMAEYDPICDGCAQSESDCLCEVDPSEAADCDSIYHPGCDQCKAK